ncbi:hypothetical protein EON65_21320 [archaeon]|nr:MAG: hypothetical protein EON65_21320 [archaeon]
MFTSGGHVETLTASALSPALLDTKVGGLPHPGVSKVLRLFQGSKESYIVHTYAKHSLLSVSRFHASTTLSSGTLGNTTGLGCKDLRLRFIIYQLLHAVCYIHQAGLCLDSLLPCNVHLDDDMWLSIPPGLSNRVLQALQLQVRNDALSLRIPRSVDYYEPISIQWIAGKVSNLEYLMAINYAAGRTMVDPLYHPLIPWVTDFSASCLDDIHGNNKHSFRDLHMTKFRLSKGDAQLETTYKHSFPSHNIPESLSELTYYIYMARRTPLHILRRVVRDVFVPEHYPQSMHRIYEWTPDECIPEFFLDPTVFQSNHLHLGLGDLELPVFAPTPSEFIAYHRAVLESDFVSSQLHHWIDLTFGYCLDGVAAVQNMNVPLKHTLTSSERMGLDTPNVNKNPGFVMLFDKAHPAKQANNPKTKAHIFAYNNAKDRTESFESLNPVLHVDNRSKYTSKELTNTPPGDVFGINAFMLDGYNNRSFMNLSALQRPSYPPVARESTLGPATKDTQQFDVNNISLSAVRRSRKSLTKPHAESSLLRLKAAQTITFPQENDSCSSVVVNLNSQMKHVKFAAKMQASLEASYELLAEGIEVGEQQEVVQELQDTEFLDAELCKALDATQFFQARRTTMPYPSTLQQLQMQDMFAVGCMIAELYLGRPLFSENDTMLLGKTQSAAEAIKMVYRATAGLPLVVKRLVVSLVQPHRQSRPKAIELLKACFVSSDADSSSNATDETPYERALVLGLRHGSFDESVYNIPLLYDDGGYVKGADYSKTDISFIRLELLSDYCGSLFPMYFRTVYSLVGAIKMAKNSLSKLFILVKNIQQLQLLPLEGVHLALYHVLDVIGDSSPFQELLRSNSIDSAAGLNSSSNPSEMYILANYWRIVDVVGIRLGIEGTDKLLVPQVIKFLNGFRSPELLTELLKSNLWSVLAHRAGVRCFLRWFLPQLLTFVSAGTLYDVLMREKQGRRSENAPLWAVSESTDKSTDWLRGTSTEAVSEVQLAAVTALRDLAEPYSLGSGIVARYILPSLLSLVGIPQLAIGGFERHSNDHRMSEEDAKKLFNNVVAQKAAARALLTDDDRPNISDIADSPPPGGDRLDSSSSKDNQDKVHLERYVTNKAVFRAQDMHVIRAVVDIAHKVGELVTSELILANILNVAVADLETQLPIATSKPGVAAATMEVILLITGLLPMLSPQTVQHDVLQPSKISECCLPKLLSCWPLAATWTFLDDITDSDLSSVEKCVEGVRMHTVLTELCRLLVSASMIVGPEACGEFVLPHVDIFFKNFVSVFGMIPVESRTMMKAFELGAALYMPLLQLVGPEAFYTSVPNVNPRLDMWLSSIGSHVPLKSPPLPSNIWPEVTNEVTNQPEKKKGLMQWISGRSKWMSSLTSSSSTKENVAAVATSTSARSSSITTGAFFSPHPVREESTVVAISSAALTPSIPTAQVVSFTNPTPMPPPVPASVVKKRESIPASASKTPLRLAQLLHRTPVQSTFISPTEGTELVEMDGGDASISRLVATNVHANGDFDNEGHDVSALLEAKPGEEGGIVGEGGENGEGIAGGETAADSVIESDLDPSLRRIHSRVESDEDDSDDDSALGDMENKVERVVNFMDADSENSPVSPSGKHIEIAMDVAPAALSPPNSEPVDEAAKKQLEGGVDVQYLPRKSMEDVDIPFTHYQRLIEVRAKGYRSSQQSLKKRDSQGRTPAKRASATKMTAMLYSSESVESPEEVESRESKYSEMTWLLAGSGRWNVEKEVKDKNNKEHNKLLKGIRSSTMYYTNGMEWNPAAQMSMTTPKIAVDVASDATSWINFNYHSDTQFKLEDSPGLIRCMVANANESLLMTCSRTGVRLWSLSSHPLLHISSYTKHSLPPYQAAFLRNGQHAVTCDGSIHLWDIESRTRLDMIMPSNSIVMSSDKSPVNLFSSMSVIGSKFGINPALGDIGDDQLLATMQDSLYYYDIRCHTHSSQSLCPVAQWVLPQLPAPQSNFISSSVEPLQLTCAISHEHYAYAGSSTGGMWVVDRRMGRTLHSWQAHDGPVMKVNLLLC